MDDVIVCHCARVSDVEIVAAIADGATDRDGVSALCGAGLECGGCLPVIDALLATGRARASRCAPGPAAAVAGCG